jgi:hypothetical protein
MKKRNKVILLGAVALAAICAVSLYAQFSNQVTAGVQSLVSVIPVSPPTAGGTTVGTTALPYAGVFLGTSAANNGEKSFASVALTAAGINGWNATPQLVIAAQGSGTLIELDGCVLDLIYGSAAFTSGGTVTIGYGTSATVAAAATIASTVFTSFSANQAIKVAGSLAVTATSSLLNQPIYVTNATGAFATGTGATGFLDCQYIVHKGLS